MEAPEHQLPFVSVIMPVRNEGSFIQRSLAAVIGQDYSNDRLEVLVVDGMSTDNTRSVVSSMMSVHGRISILDNPKSIAPTAMNIGIDEAKGGVIIRVDGHCEIAPDYVRCCVQHLLTDGVDAVGGSVETVGETSFARIVAAAMSSNFGVGGSAFRTMRDKTLIVDTVPFPAYLRSVFERIGKFDEEMVRNQDDEFNYRLQEAGGRILLASDVKSRYYSRGTIKGLWRQHFQYGYWKVRVMQKHPRQMRLRHFVPVTFVTTVLILAFLSPFYAYARWTLVMVAGLYVAANLLASLQLALKTGVRYFPLIPIVFGALHVSYGLGFLRGLLKFRKRWPRHINE